MSLVSVGLKTINSEIQESKYSKMVWRITRKLGEKIGKTISNPQYYSRNLVKVSVF